MERYGVPYKGSKSKIAKWIVDLLPHSHMLVDLFAGGCAVTHCAMLSGKWERFVVNDLTDAPTMFIDAIKVSTTTTARFLTGTSSTRRRIPTTLCRCCTASRTMAETTYGRRSWSR